MRVHDRQPRPWPARKVCQRGNTVCDGVLVDGAPTNVESFTMIHPADRQQAPSRSIADAPRRSVASPTAHGRRLAARLVLAGLGALLAAGPVAAGHVLLGAHVSSESSKTRRAQFVALETAIGTTLAIDSDYNDWGAFPNSERVIWDRQYGRRTMLSWRVVFQSNAKPLRCATAVDIFHGVYDVQLAHKAALLKALGVPILVRFNYEMTDNQENTCFTGFPVSQNFPLAGARFVAAWNHIVRLFRAHGVRNVEWVFAPSADAYEKGHWIYFYPGAANVDWMAADQYNPTDIPRSFAVNADILAFYNVAAPLGKPLMISETGANEDPSRSPDAQTAWLNTAHTFFKNHPALAALVYWDDSGQYAKQHPGYGGTGYILSGAGLAAFKAIATDPYF
jgi:hypothetical protein